MKRSLFILFFIFFSATISYSATITNNAGGNWSAGGTWIGGVVPVAGDSVVIASGTVTVDINTAIVKSVNVQPNCTLLTSGATSDLKLSDGLTIQNNAQVTNSGSIE